MFKKDTYPFLVGLAFAASVCALLYYLDWPNFTDAHGLAQHWKNDFAKIFICVACFFGGVIAFEKQQG